MQAIEAEIVPHVDTAGDAGCGDGGRFAEVTNGGAASVQLELMMVVMEVVMVVVVVMLMMVVMVMQHQVMGMMIGPIGPPN